LNHRIRRLFVLISLITFIGWALFIFMGWHSYLVSAPEAPSRVSESYSGPVLHWEATAGDPDNCPPVFPELEEAILEKVNERRDRNRLGRLEFDSLLSAAARCEATIMLSEGIRGFTSPDGSHLDERISTWATDRIGISRGLQMPIPHLSASILSDAEDIVRGWHNPGKQQALLADPGYDLAGVGVARGGDSAVVVLILYADLIRLDEHLPLRLAGDSTLSVNGEYTNNTTEGEIKVTLEKQGRGFFTRYDHEPMPLEVNRVGNRLQMELSFDGKGLYLLRGEAGDRLLDTHPIEVY